MTGFIGIPLVEGQRMAEGVGNAPTSAMPILFSRQAQPACICLPSVNKLMVERAGRSGFCLSLSTLSHKLSTDDWLPDLDSHQDKRFNKPPCYFDTTWQWRCRQDSHLHRSV
jgi:hypothetical protein